MKNLIALLGLSACASSSTPASQPVVSPRFVSVGPGELTPDDGFFITTEGMRAWLTRDHGYHLDLQHDSERWQARDKEHSKEAAKGAFCLRWCVPLTIGGMLIVEAIAVGAYVELKR